LKNCLSPLLQTHGRNAEQPFEFAGCLYDKDTKLCHFGAREYDAQVGRFISKDPIWPRGGLNPYTYAYNSPLNFIDPTGLSVAGGIAQIGLGGAIAVGGILGAGQLGGWSYAVVGFGIGILANGIAEVTGSNIANASPSSNQQNSSPLDPGVPWNVPTNPPNACGK
jgi:RHS repeat-associated protein